jgi:hypothetical protein
LCHPQSLWPAGLRFLNSSSEFIKSGICDQ